MKRATLPVAFFVLGLATLLVVAGCSKDKPAPAPAAAQPAPEPAPTPEPAKDYVTVTSSKPFVLSNSYKADTLDSASGDHQRASQQDGMFKLRLERKDLLSHAFVADAEGQVLGTYKLPKTTTAAKIDLDSLDKADYLPQAGIKVSPNVTLQAFPSEVKGVTITMPGGIKDVKFEELVKVPGFWVVERSTDGGVFATFDLNDLDEAKALAYSSYYREHVFEDQDKARVEKLKGPKAYEGLDGLTCAYYDKVRIFDKLPLALKLAIVKATGPVVLGLVRPVVGDDVLRRFANTTWEQVKSTNPHLYFSQAQHYGFDTNDPNKIQWPETDPDVFVPFYGGTWHEVQLRQILARRGEEVFRECQAVVRAALAGGSSAAPVRHGIPKKK